MSNLQVTNITADRWVSLDGSENHKVKFWGEFQTVGGITSLVEGANISSIVDYGVGNYAINLIQGLPTRNYALLLTAADADNHGDGWATPSNSATEKTSTMFKVYTAGGGGKYDPPFFSVMGIC